MVDTNDMWVHCMDAGEFVKKAVARLHHGMLICKKPEKGLLLLSPAARAEFIETACFNQLKLVSKPLSHLFFSYTVAGQVKVKL